MIFVLGDSHSGLFNGLGKIPMPGPHNYDTLPGYRTYSIGTIVSCLFYEKQFKGVLKILKEKVNKEQDWVLMTVGETNFRYDFLLFAKQNKVNVFDVVEEWFLLYFAAVKKLRSYGYKVCVFSSHPTTNNEPDPHPSHPIEQNVYVRNMVGLYWNKLAKQYCEAFNIAYASIYEDILKDDYSSDDTYFQDFCHLNTKILPIATERVEEAIRNKLQCSTHTEK